MKRRLLCIAGAVGALLSVGALGPAAPAQAEELVRVCATVSPKFVGIEVNGIPIGVGHEGTPRTCVAV